jgi:hypothetical protein
MFDFFKNYIVIVCDNYFRIVVKPPINNVEFIPKQTSLGPTHVFTTPQPSLIRQSRELNLNSPWLNLSHHHGALSCPYSRPHT